jgi:hypothetical protein
MRLLLTFFSFLLLFNVSVYSEKHDSAEYDEPEKPEPKEDKKKHDITDTKKRLDIRKGDIADPHKKLDIRRGDLVNTKGMLRRTDFPNKDQLAMLRWELSVKLKGGKNYRIAYNKSSRKVSSRLQYSWKIKQEESDLFKRKKSLNAKDISEARKKFVQGKIKEVESTITTYRKKLESIDKELFKLVGSEKRVGTGDFFSNTVTSDDPVDLVDKFGQAKLRLKKGSKVKTRLSKRDPSNFYEVDHKGTLLYVMRKYFQHQ